MSIVNFAISKPLEKQINQAIKDRGFASKAEFFRFTAISFLSQENEKSDVDREYEKVAKLLSETLVKKYKNKKMPSVREQFADLL